MVDIKVKISRRKCCDLCDIFVNNEYWCMRRH